MTIAQTGISPSFKVPLYITRIVLAAGARGAGSQRLRVLAVGMKTSAGSIVPDEEVVRVTDENEVDAAAGPGADLAMQGYQLVRVPSVEAYLAAVTEPGAGSAATATIELDGTTSTPGTHRFRIAGKTVPVDVPEGSDEDDVGAAIVTAFNGRTRLPVTAAYNSGTSTVTITCKNKGLQGRQWILYHDAREAPSGQTLTIVGSASVNGGKGVRLGAAASGSGSPDVTTLLTKLQNERYARIAPSHNDAVNAALWEEHVNTKGTPTKQLYEQVVFGHNGSLSDAMSLSQTTLNAFFAQVCWLRNGENHPGEIAALVAAIRSVTEQSQPVPDYDGLLLASLAPQAFAADVPTLPEQDIALNAGLTPLTTVNGQVRMVRAVCTYCLDGAQQDERCLDIGDPTMAQYAALDLQEMYYSEFRTANPYVGPDPDVDEEPPPEGVAFPALWTSKANARAETWYENRWTRHRPRGEWSVRSEYDAAGDFIRSETPLPVRRIQHRLDNTVRQIANQV